mmetsp:Transcript_9674/g.10176  ORF Transcript_9674/g.10176 Transcript_9674/m.10176 type:complete len:240 (+) Transcript_9674:57-776(+)
MKRTLGITLLGAGALAIHTSYLDYKRNNTKIETGTENLVLNELTSGDLIFFQRKPENYPISTALSILISQKYFKDSSVDHCALVVEDNIGRPFIYELTPTGPKLTPFVQRISSSLSGYIVQVPLLKSDIDEVLLRKQLFQHAITSIENKNRSETIEIYQHFFNKLTNSSTKTNTTTIAPSVDLVLKAYQSAGIQIQSNNPQDITCTNLLESQHSLIYTPNEKKNQESIIFGPPNVIRLL